MTSQIGGRSQFHLRQGRRYEVTRLLLPGVDR